MSYGLKTQLCNARSDLELGNCFDRAKALVGSDEATLLVSQLLNVSFTELHTARGRLMCRSDVEKLNRAIQRRLSGEPIAYITGSKKFRNLNISVTPDVLIPRFETELLVDVVIKFTPHTGRVLDLGTGSGAIAIALSKINQLQVVAVDNDASALQVCSENCHRLEADVEIIRSNWFERVDGCFDTIVSNPPYVAANDPHLNSGDLRYEPPNALVGGTSGIEHLEEIINSAMQFLNLGGWLVVEHGHDQQEIVKGLFANRGTHGSKNVETIRVRRGSFGGNGMDDKQLLRYSRHIMLPELDILGQEKINASHVAIIGLGGLGCPVAMYLAASGIGELTLVDDDVVELSNLQRQIAHTEESIGITKVDAAAYALQGLNSQTEINKAKIRVDASELSHLLKNVAVVVDATDNFATRFTINEVSRKLKLPLVSGAAIRMEGQVMVLDPRIPESPCYRCLYPEAMNETQNCAENGVLAPLVGIIGSLQALETLKVICEFAHDSIGWVHYFDAKRMEWRKLRLKRNPSCPECGV